jgi:hypothetical protein
MLWLISYYHKIQNIILNNHIIWHSTKYYTNKDQKKKVVGLERGPFSLVSTTEELLDRKVAAPV